MNPHTLQVLDFRRILEILAEEAHSALGRRYVLSMAPEADLPAIGERQAHISEMRRLLQEEPKWPVLNLGDPEATLEQLGTEGAILEAEELLEIAKLGELSLSCRKVLRRKGMSERFPLMSGLVGGCWDDEGPVRRVRSAFDERGNVLDDASSALRKIRRRRNNLRQETSARAESLLHRAGHVPEGVENFVTLRSGRYVVALPAELTKRVPGILHDRSHSGRTHVLEPLDLVEANNALTDLDTEEREEVRRILLELTEAFRQGLHTLRETCRVLGKLDGLGGIARWSLRWKGSLPLVTEEKGSMRLVGARHPLLCRALGSLESVVPLDLEMSPKLRCLVVSGPNMGGKSVLLRTVGITVMLARCGLPVLAREGTEIPAVYDILVDIGDEQSMESDLSTFAAHLRNLREMEERASERTLLLIDEIGSGTDPQEGAALGLTLLTELHGRGGLILVTTHMGAFKDFAAQTPGAGNGSMEFDRETLRPRYRFLPGVPGRSHAFEVASMEGWPEERMREAGRRLEESTRQTDALLRELEEMRETLSRQEREVRKRHEEAESVRSRYQSLAQRLRDRLDKIRMEKSVEEDQLLRELRELRSKLQLSLEQVEDEPEAAKAEGRDTLKKADSVLRRRRRRRMPRRTRRPRIPLDELVPGREVWCEEFRSNVKLDSLSAKQGKAWVRAGALRVEVPVGSLSRPEGEPATKTGAEATREFIELRSSQPPSSEVDLRGMDREEGLRTLDLYLDRALLSGLQRVRIIHGIGKGILMEQVGAYLRSLSFIDSFRPGEPGEGGTGVTIAFLESKGRKG